MPRLLILDENNHIMDDIDIKCVIYPGGEQDFLLKYGIHKQTTYPQGEFNYKGETVSLIATPAGYVLKVIEGLNSPSRSLCAPGALYDYERVPEATSADVDARGGVPVG